MGGAGPVSFCESCWANVHWAPPLTSHVKCHPGSEVMDRGRVIGSSMICDKHGLQRDLFCETDGAFICPTCSFTSSHKVGWSSLKCEMQIFHRMKIKGTQYFGWGRTA
ncbi:hypothetical protein Pelo_19446 [Pelomyxa schiedti]|nr:hypothetical protein Pelo_19446 [Pelomyxa schiedti]